MVENRNRGGKVWFWIRVAGSVIFLGILLGFVDFAEIVDLLRNGEFIYYLAALVLFVFNQLGFTYRWQRLLAAQGVNLGIRYLFKIYLLGFTWNLILPTTVGGDAVKIYRLIQERPDSKAEILAATLTDRVIGMFALLHWCLVGIWLVTWWPLDVKFLLSTILGGVLLAGYLIVVGNVVPRLAGVLGKTRLPVAIKRYTMRLVEVFVEYRRALPMLALCLSLSLVSQVVYIFNQYLMLRALGISVPFSYLMLVMPVVTLISALPISIGGIGIMEAGLTLFLGHVGVSATEVVSYSLLRYSIPVILGIVILAINLLQPLLERRS